VIRAEPDVFLMMCDVPGCARQRVIGSAILARGDTWSDGWRLAADRHECPEHSFALPSWVPADVRDMIARDWSLHGGADAWRLDASAAHRGPPPALGEVVTLARCDARSLVTGRYVHAWNDLGRIIDEHGTAHTVSCSRALALHVERILAAEVAA